MLRLVVRLDSGEESSGITPPADEDVGHGEGYDGRERKGEEGPEVAPLVVVVFRAHRGDERCAVGSKSAVAELVYNAVMPVP
jgi:hypothetical protein